MELLKRREAKKSERGIYIQDRELLDSNFEPGEHFAYEIDRDKRLIRIVPSKKRTNNTVSKRKQKDVDKPVLDIRNKNALSIFSECSKLYVEIYKDEILVTGEAIKESKILPFRKKKTVSYSAKINMEELFNVVGDCYGQISLFSTGYFPSKGKNGLNPKAIKDLKIPLALISLFSGAGMMDLGFKEVGFDVELAVELSSEAAKTYRQNIGNHIDVADITTYDKGRFKVIGSPVMIGGSPCQGFSAANRSTNFLENPNNLLVKHYIESIKANPNCKVFVLENVPQILTAGGGAFKEEIESALSDFEITSGVLNAADYGEAQIRKRAFMIGSKIGRIDLPLPTHKKEDYKTVRDAFANLSDLTPNQRDYSKPRTETIEKMSYVPQGGNWKDIPNHLKTEKMKNGSTHSSVYRRLDNNKPSIAITNPRKSNILHPSLDRSLSIRECARLFGLPDSFVFKGTLFSMQQQVCNGVPVKLAKAIAEKVKETILQYNIRIRASKPQIVYC